VILPSYNLSKLAQLYTVNFLDSIGQHFVYRSPDPWTGYINGLRQLTSKKLQKLAGTKTHYSKKTLIAMFLAQ